MSSLRRKVSQDVSSPWYDAHVLLQRLRRLDDMKAFVDQYKAMQQQRAVSNGRGGGGGGGKGKRYQFGSGEDPCLPCLLVDISFLFLVEADDAHDPDIFLASGSYLGGSSFRYQERWKNTKQSLEEVERTAAIRRQASHRAKQNLHPSQSLRLCSLLSPFLFLTPHPPPLCAVRH